MEKKTSVIFRKTYRSQLTKLCNQVKELIKNKETGREEVVAIIGKIKQLKCSLSEVDEKVLASVRQRNLEEECEKIAEHELAAAEALALAEDFLSNLCKNPGKDHNASDAATVTNEDSAAQLPSVKAPNPSLPKNRVTKSEENLVCAVCQKSSSLRCAGCRKIYYCSKEHQKLDWKVHKKSCGPGVSSTCFKIAKDQKIGRHLVSTRLISEGEIVLEEDPLVTGPSGDPPPVCLGCYKLLNHINSRNCSRCNWPVCSRDCENSKAHKPECEITTKFKKEKVNITNFETKRFGYISIIVVRCLYLKSTNRATWEKVNALESHMEQRKSCVRFGEFFRKVARFIQRFFNFHEFSEEDIFRMAGIVDINGHVIPREESDFIAIYDKGSMIEHSCFPNCSRSFTKAGKLVIRAARKIQEGEHLSISYTPMLWSRKKRQDHLLLTKYFVCGCDRCSDPTELGTYFDSWKCPTQECRGYMVHVPKSGLPVEYHWQCVECRRFYSDDGLLDSVEALTEGISILNGKNPGMCKMFLLKYKKYLHPNHYFMVSVELELLKSYREMDIVFMSDEDIKYVINIINHLIDLTSKLTPADYTLRGYLYYMLHVSMTELLRRNCSSGEKDGAQLQQHLLMSRDLLVKAYSFLTIEPEAFEEGNVAIEALKNIHLLENLMKGV